MRSACFAELLKMVYVDVTSGCGAIAGTEIESAYNAPYAVGFDAFRTSDRIAFIRVD